MQNLMKIHWHQLRPQMHLFKSVTLHHSVAGSRFGLVTHTHGGCSLHSEDGEGLDTRNEGHHECQWIFFKFCMQLPWHISCILPKFQHCASLLEIAGDIILLLIPPNRPASFKFSSSYGFSYNVIWSLIQKTIYFHRIYTCIPHDWHMLLYGPIDDPFVLACSHIWRTSIFPILPPEP